MKVVLRQDVDKVGEKGSVQTVSDGFARNYLIPKGLAVLATAGELRHAEEIRSVQERKIAKQEQAQRELSDRINGLRLTFQARAGSQGRLYGSVTGGDIADRLSKAVGTDVDRHKIVLENPIRSLGEHKVIVHLVGRLRPEVTVVVESDGVIEEDDGGAEGEDAVEAVAETEPAAGVGAEA